MAPESYVNTGRKLTQGEDDGAKAWVNPATFRYAAPACCKHEQLLEFVLDVLNSPNEKFSKTHRINIAIDAIDRLQ